MLAYTPFIARSTAGQKYHCPYTRLSPTACKFCFSALIIYRNLYTSIIDYGVSVVWLIHIGMYPLALILSQHCLPGLSFYVLPLTIYIINSMLFHNLFESTTIRRHSFCHVTCEYLKTNLTANQTLFSLHNAILVRQHLWLLHNN